MRKSFSGKLRTIHTALHSVESRKKILLCAKKRFNETQPLADFEVRSRTTALLREPYEKKIRKS
jgi:hypothetical protein